MKKDWMLEVRETTPEVSGLLDLITKKIQTGFLGPQKLSIFAETRWRFYQ